MDKFITNKNVIIEKEKPVKSSKKTKQSLKRQAILKPNKKSDLL